MRQPLAEMAFYRTERPILIAQGIVDYDQQCALLKRRSGMPSRRPNVLKHVRQTHKRLAFKRLNMAYLGLIA